jgi:hypothetical protein
VSKADVCRNGNPVPLVRGLSAFHLAKIAMKKWKKITVGCCVHVNLLFALGVSPSAAADIHKDWQPFKSRHAWRF